jgi:hypothetical protein
MTKTTENQDSQRSTNEELGIVELDARLDMTFDPLAAILDPTTAQANDCNNNCGHLKLK